MTSLPPSVSTLLDTLVGRNSISLAANSRNRKQNTKLIPSLVLRVTAVMLFAKTFLAVLYEYQWYFPVNFEHSTFLSGREDMFQGAYRSAFYCHLFVGPTALLLAVFLMTTGASDRLRVWHRLAGRVQFVFVTLLVASGTVMAKDAFAGPAASLGFYSLAGLTFFTLCISTLSAVRRDIKAHRRWANRCFVLLCSPLLLRIAGGFAATFGEDSLEFYRWNAWLSWLIPLLCFEAHLLKKRLGRSWYLPKLPSLSKPVFKIGAR